MKLRRRASQRAGGVLRVRVGGGGGTWSQALEKFTVRCLDLCFFIDAATRAISDSAFGETQALGDDLRRLRRSWTLTWGFERHPCQEVVTGRRSKQFLAAVGNHVALRYQL